MPIELTATTRRSTYFAGESITVEINISNIYQMVNRYFSNSHVSNQSTQNQVAGLPGTSTTPNVSCSNVSPYGSINGIPSIGQMNQMKSVAQGAGPPGSRSACMTPNNSSMNLLADYTDQMNLNLGHEAMKDDKSTLGSIGSVGTLKDHGAINQGHVGVGGVGVPHGSVHGSTKSRHSKSRNHPSLYQNPSHERAHGTGRGSSSHADKNLINTLATNCSSSDASERVAWVSVYMHCECNVNRNKVALQNISAALAPVKSVFSHDFEGTNTDIQSHLFEEPGSGEPGSAGTLRAGLHGHPLPKSNVNLKSSGDTDSGVGGISSGAGSAPGSNASGATAGKSGAPGSKTDILPKTSLAPDRDSTGICVLQTPPQILVCDLTLKPGEHKKLAYREKIPVEAPPSYSGSLLKYSYKLTVSVQRVGGSIKQIKLPFRVLVLYGLSDYQGFEEMPLNSNPFLDQPLRTIKPSNDLMYNSLLASLPRGNTNHNMFPTNCELDSNQHNSNLLDLASDLLNRITAKRRPTVYNIANSQGVVGTFCMPKLSYRLGEDVVGIFDFCGTVPCVQLETSLQMEEVVVDEFKKRSGQPNSVTPYHKQISNCLFTKKQAIVVPIPLYVSPEFMTEVVILRWRLHFEFVYSTKPLEGQVLEDMTGNTMWQGPFNIKTSGMTWDLPIKILPTVPALAEGAISNDRCQTIHF